MNACVRKGLLFKSVNDTAKQSFRRLNLLIQKQFALYGG